MNELSAAGNDVAEAIDDLRDVFELAVLAKEPADPVATGENVAADAECVCRTDFRCGKWADGLVGG